MRATTTRIAAGLAAAVLTATLAPAPAAASEPFKNPDTGLVFYNNDPAHGTIVGRQAAPDDVCRPIPANATWLLAWSGFQTVIAYASPDCSGYPYTLGIWRSWTPGTFLSYKTV